MPERITSSTWNGTKAAAIRYLVLPEGCVSKVSGLEEARKAQGVVRCDVDLPVGKRIRGFTNSVERHGYVLASGSTRDEAIENVSRALEMIQVELS